MGKIQDSGRNNILSLLRHRIETRKRSSEDTQEISLTKEEVSEILKEIHMTQIELEMQYDELNISYQTRDAERAKFIELFDMAPVGYFILDHAGMVEEANSTGATLLQRSKTEIHRVNFKDFICPGSWETFQACLYRMQQLQSKQNCEIKLRINQNEVYCRIEGAVIYTRISGQLKFYITLIDITENRKSELSHYEASERLKMVLKASSSGILTIDLETLSVYMDDFSYTLLNLDPGSFSGNTFDILESIHPEDRGKVNLGLRKAILGNKDIDIEFRTNYHQAKVIAVKGHNIQAGEKRFFAGLLIDRTRQRRLEQEAENLRLNQQKMIMGITLTAQEKERAMISQVLHDSVCQLLYGIKLNLQNMQFSNRYKGPFQNINFLLDQVIKETRNISYELTPSVLSDFGFVAGVKEMAQRLSTKTFIIDTIIDVQADLLHPKIQLYLFRIIQELINNCIKHANASRVRVQVTIDNNKVTALVIDNGKGFSKSMDQSLKAGSGLRGIKNRVFLLNGQVALESSKKGTISTITFENDPASMDMDDG